MSRLLIPFLLLLPTLAVAQMSLFDHLTTADDVVVHLDTDWNHLTASRNTKTYQPATVRLRTPTLDLELKARVRTRGNVRLEVCQLPGLKVKLSKKALRAAGFSDLNELKFVLQCSDNATGDGYLRREQALYDLHAIFSPYHLRTVPARLRLGGDRPRELAIFLIEHKEQVAARYRSEVLESERASTRGLVRSAYVNLCLFNYLILNTDWQIFNLHNVEFISRAGTPRSVPIPYDFDYAGLVGTAYAVPHPSRDIATVHEALWLGRDVTAGELTAGAAHYVERRLRAETFVRDHPHLSERTKRRWLRRLARFYDEIGDERRRKRLLR